MFKNRPNPLNTVQPLPAGTPFSPDICDTRETKKLMASTAQILANRENAQHSTGPRTGEGKSRTRLNGIRHGLTGQTILLPEEDREAYNRHCHNFLEDLNPKGAVETQIAQSMADDYWRLNRIKAIEDNILALGIEAYAGNFSDDARTDHAFAQAQTYLEEARQINLISLYEGRLNRAIAKKAGELSELQRIRKVAAATKGNGSGFSTKPVTPAGSPNVGAAGSFCSGQTTEIRRENRRLDL